MNGERHVMVTGLAIASESSQSPDISRTSSTIPIKSENSIRGVRQNTNYSSDRQITSSADPLLLHETYNSSPPLVKRLGKWLIIANISAVVLLTLAVSGLLFLWFGGDANEQWRRIMINGYVGQAVTLSTLAIRLALATEAGAAISMLASTLIEQHGVPLHQAPAISIMRFMNKGPVLSAFDLWSGGYWYRNSLIYTLLVLLACTTSISQFTSTLLLWDIESGNVLGFPIDTDVDVGFSMSDYMEHFRTLLIQAPNYWASTPSTYNTFAEWSAEPEDLPDNVADTGPTIRAMLPITSSNDLFQLEDYSGTASLFDARVACFRPTIKDPAFNFDLQVLENFTGTLLPSSLPEDIQDASVLSTTDIFPDGFPFTCRMDNMQVGKSFFVCGLPRTAGGLINSLDPMNNKSLIHNLDPPDPGVGLWHARSSNESAKWPVLMGHTVLFWTRTPGKNQNPSSHTGGYDVVEKGPWLEYTLRDTGDVWSVSACLDALYGQNFYFRPWHDQDFSIIAKRGPRPQRRQDSIPRWDPSSDKFDTQELRVQLGSTTDEQTSRDILYLDHESIRSAKENRMSSWAPERNCTFRPSTHGIWWYPNTTLLPSALGPNPDCLDLPLPSSSPLPPASLINHDFLNEAIWTHMTAPYTLVGLSANSTYSPTTTSTATGFTASPLHPILAALALDVLAATSDPARAWQALVTCVLRSAYADTSSYFTARAPASTTALRAPQRPVRWRGLGVVLVDVLVQQVLVAVAVGWFARGTRWSLLGNCWQGVAQLRGGGAGEVEEVMGRAGMETDGEVGEWIKERGMRGLRFRVGRGEAGVRLRRISGGEGGVVSASRKG